MNWNRCKDGSLVTTSPRPCDAGIFRFLFDATSSTEDHLLRPTVGISTETLKLVKALLRHTFGFQHQSC